MPELMIFKAGKYPQGDWPKERVKKLVDAYDPEKDYDAPLVIGHRWYGTDDRYQDAHGWVESLRMDGAGKVFATVTDVSADVKKKVAEKKLKYMSVEIYEHDKVDDKPPYLRAIALLGRDTPAVAGARLPAYFSLAPGGLVCFAKEEEHTTMFTSKVGAAEIQTLSIEETTNHKEDTTVDKTEELQAELAKKEEMLAAFKKENDALKQAGKKAEAEAYFGRLRDKGKLTPDQFEQLVGIDMQIDGESQKAFRAFFDTAKPVIDLSGRHYADKKDAPASGASESALAAQIRAFQRERNLSSFEDAAKILHVEKPALFTEERNQ
jgi:hypothetical protein